MERSLPMRERKRPNSPHPAIIPESSRFGLVAPAVTLLFLWTALTSQTILRLHHSNHTRLRSGGLILSGGHPRAKAPLVLGNEGAGVVKDAGDSGLAVGSRVMFTGPYGVGENGAWPEWLLTRPEHLAFVPDAID